MIGTALTEEDAFQLLRGWSVVPEEKKPLARAKLAAYRDERVANGEPLWPNRQAARERAEVERQEKLWLTDQVTDSPESQLVRQIDFLSTVTQREPYLVSIEPNRYRRAVAGYLGDPAAGESPEAFDAFARRHVQKQRDRRLLIDGDGNPENPDNGSSLTGFAADAARAGRTAVESWADWSRGASVKPGFAEAMADGEGLFTHFSRVHDRARRQWQDFGQRADGILRELEARTNDWSPILDTTAALPYLDGLTPPQRDAVLGLVVERAKAKDKGLGQQTGEAVGRVFARLVEAQVDVGERAATLSIFREGDPVPERLASDPAALVSLEMMRTARGFGVGPTSKLEYPEPPSGPTVKLTKEQADAANKAAAMRTESVSVAAKLRDIARGAVDPVKGSNWFTDSVYYPALNVAASIGSSAVPGGWLANLTAYVGDEQNRLEAAGVSPEVAGVQSLIVGGAQAAIDRLQLSLLKRLPSFSQLEGVSSRYWNTLPRVAAWTASPAASGVGALGRRSVGALATAGGEMLTEVVQQGFPLFTQKVFKWLGADEPDVPWSEIAKEAWAVAPDTFFGMLPLVMLGAGVGSVRDYKNVRSLVGDASALRQIGFADEQIERITKAGDAEAMVRALQAEWGGRTPIVGPAASPQEQANLDVLRDPTAPVGAVAAAAQTSARVETVRQVMQEMQAAAGVRSVRRTESGWVVLGQDGEAVTTATPEEARAAIIGMGRARSEKEAGAMMSLIDYFAGQDAAEGVGSVTSVSRAAVVARQREDGTTEAVAVNPGESDAEVLAWKPETMAQLKAEMQAAGVTEAAILGMNSALADDSGRLVRAYQTNAGADIRTILHERFERLYREGRVTQEQVWWAANRLTSLPQFDPARIRDEGQRRVAESLRRIATEDPTVTDAERQETMIDLVVADVLGRWQDGEKLPAGAIEAGIMEASMLGMTAEDQAAMTTFRAVWRAVKSYLKSMFGIAARIAQARRKGQIKDGDEWSGFVDRLLGVDVDKRHVEAVVEDAGVGSFSLAPTEDSGSVDENEEQRSIRSPDRILAGIRSEASGYGEASDGKRRKPGREVITGEQLAVWLRSKGREIDSEVFAGREAIGGGGEHLILAGDSDRVLKLTKPGFFGAQAEDAGAYLDRWSMHNAVFDDDVMVEGIVTIPGEDAPRLVVSQQFREGRGATMEELENYLSEKGFFKEGDRWVHPIRKISVWDLITEGNAIVTDSGIRVIDLQVERSNSEELRSVSERTGVGRATSFSLGSVNTLEAIAARLEERAAAGGAEAKLEIYQNLSRTLEGMARAARGNEETEQIIAAGAIDAKRRELQQRLEDEYILEIYANPIGEALTSEAATAIKENEFLRQFIDPSKKGLVGRFRSPKRARAAGRGMGEYEDAIRRGLPSWLFRGPDSPAGAPDVIASNLDVPMDVPEMWERIELELDSVARARASLEKSQDAVREAKARARTEAKDWALSERAKLAASDKRDESRTLITLDAILLQLPAEVRGRLGGFTKLSQLKTNDVRRKHFLEMVGKIDVELERYLRRSYVATIRELFVKSKPRRMAGEKDRGRLGVNAHTWVETAEEVSKWDETKLEERADYIEKRLAGAEKIGEQAISDLNRKWDLGEGEDAARMALEQESAILDLFGGMTHFEKGVPVKGSGELEAALMALRATITTGRLVREAEILRRRADRETRRLQLQADAKNGGKPADIKAREESMQGLSGNAVKFARKGFSVEQLVGDIFGRNTQTHRFAEDTVLAAELAETAAFNQAQSDLAAFLKSLWPRTGRLGRLRNLEAMATPKEVPGAPAGAPRFSQMEAVHMTMLWSDLDSRDWLTMHGFGNDMQTALEAYLTPEAKAVRTWLAEWYDDQYDSLNEVYRRIHGTNMPRVRNYSPRMVEHGKDAVAVDPLGMGGLSARGVFSGFTKRRRPTLTAAPVLADALQAWAQNQRVVTHFLAWAEASSELRAVFSTSATATYVKAAAGIEGAADLNQWLSDLEAGGVADAQAFALLKRWLKANTTNALFGKLGVLAKQIPAAYGSAAEVGWSDWIKSARRVLAGDAARTRSEAAQSRIMQGRAFTRPDEFLQAASGRGASPATGYVRRVTGVDLNAIDIALREIGGAIGRTDAFFTSFSAAVAYDARFREAKESGDSDDAAHAYAERETERIIARTAQPETLANKSLFENRMPDIGRLFFAFQSANRQALFMTAAAFRDGGMKSGEAWRKAVTHWVITGLVTQTVGNIVRDLLTDDDEEEIWETGDYMRAMLVGPFTAMLYAGPAIDALASAFGGFERRQGAGPVAAVTSLAKAVRDAMKDGGDFDWRRNETIARGLGLLLGGRFAALNVSANMAKQLVGAADNLYQTQEEAAELEKKRAKKAKAKK